MNKSDCSVKVNLVDGKENKGSKLADKSVRAYLDVEKAKEILGGGGTGGVVILDDYITLDLQKGEGRMDVEAVKPFVEEGGHIYLWNISEAGLNLQIVFTMAAYEPNEEMLVFLSPVMWTKSGNKYNFQSFRLDVPTSDGIFNLQDVGMTNYLEASYFNVGGFTDVIKNECSLTIKVNGQTYTYDGSENVEINIS